MDNLSEFLLCLNAKMTMGLRIFGPENGRFCAREPYPHTEEGKQTWMKRNHTSVQVVIVPEPVEIEIVQGDALLSEGGLHLEPPNL